MYLPDRQCCGTFVSNNKINSHEKNWFTPKLASDAAHGREKSGANPELQRLGIHFARPELFPHSYTGRHAGRRSAQ
jgi:hypothetical protein